MEHIKNTTKLIGIKDLNIKIALVLKHKSHIEVRAKLDYPAPACPHCQGKTMKYDFQRPSTIPILDVQGLAAVLKLRKRRFQCKACRRVSVAKTNLVKKHGQISQPVWTKITQLLIEKQTNTDIVNRLQVSVSTVQRQLNAFTLKDNLETLPEILSWEEFERNKGNLAFIAQDFKTKKIIAVLENNRQTTIMKHFYKYSRQAREAIKVVTVDMSGAYIPIIRKLFPRAEIVLDRFHIVQHLSRAMMTTRIAIMKACDKTSLPYRAMKKHWRSLQPALSFLGEA